MNREFQYTGILNRLSSDRYAHITLFEGWTISIFLEVCSQYPVIVPTESPSFEHVSVNC